MEERTGLPVVAMVGGGQLARMTHQAAIALGQSLRVLAVSADDPAALVAPDVVLGDHRDLDALRRAAAGAEALTFDHEHVPGELLEKLVAEGVTVHPGPEALRHAQDKLVMRRRLAELGEPVPPFAPVSSPADVEAFAAEHGWPVVLKAVRGGYDGRGVWMLGSADDTARTVPELLDAGTPLMVEQKVALRRELAVVLARSPFGQAAVYPTVETVQVDGINTEVLAPAPGLSDDAAEAAEELALRIAAALGVVGLLAVELFETPDGRVVVNELAMRPHNSAHWSMDGAVTGQFEQHLRAVLDYPLGSTATLRPACAMANVLGGWAAGETTMPSTGPDERLHHTLARFPEARVHLYGKGERPGRKIGHVNVTGDDMDDVRRRARLAADHLATGVWTDGWSAH
ncbi:5-(carboxyamino)imidazole ribonucleotide synthase [Actinomycetospora sp. TBRC 11914]|uniref:5-(carboxyamino)imidazole ribonucleotide synthase n=1 Tax=Actinomycetospora sp. TBRC 11914 TaxID=2729387 RepID=UPI00145DFCAC|nr:5-(carboxyamino)imidazole ribonucleotide synthase [Actinomycetospora sp. TBRC 11914]NMO90799.1 5-(carboxyamino)imidazole ribonucleotide synthase [Actinomycetospora sp. TBRC 11914]